MICTQTQTNPDKFFVAYLLANQGYDVWLGNRRGNTYSTKYFDPKLSDPTKFWDFR